MEKKSRMQRSWVNFQGETNVELCILVHIEDTKRIDEWKILQQILKFFFGYVPIFIVIVDFENGLEKGSNVRACHPQQMQVIDFGEKIFFSPEWKFNNPAATKSEFRDIIIGPEK